MKKMSVLKADLIQMLLRHRYNMYHCIDACIIDIYIYKKSGSTRPTAPPCPPNWGRSSSPCWTSASLSATLSGEFSTATLFNSRTEQCRPSPRSLLPTTPRCSARTSGSSSTHQPSSCVELHLRVEFCSLPRAAIDCTWE